MLFIVSVGQILLFGKVSGLWSWLRFHNKGSSSKCEPQTGEICWNKQTFLKSGGREGGQFKVFLFKWNPNKEGKQILSIIYDQSVQIDIKYVSLIQVAEI